MPRTAGAAPTSGCSNVTIDGNQVLTNFDIFAAAGGAKKAVDRTFTVNAANGSIAIHKVSSVDEPAVNDIEILPVVVQPPPQPKTVIHMNVGGPAVLDASGGPAWTADSAEGVSFATTVTILGANRPELYQTPAPKPGTLTHTFPVTNGTYDVRLMFAEIYHDTSGKRSLNLAINNAMKLTGFDVFNAAGGPNKAVDRRSRSPSSTDRSGST